MQHKPVAKLLPVHLAMVTKLVIDETQRASTSNSTGNIPWAPVTPTAAAAAKKQVPSQDLMLADPQRSAVLLMKAAKLVGNTSPAPSSSSPTPLPSYGTIFTAPSPSRSLPSPISFASPQLPPSPAPSSSASPSPSPNGPEWPAFSALNTPLRISLHTTSTSNSPAVVSVTGSSPNVHAEQLPNPFKRATAPEMTASAFLEWFKQEEHVPPTVTKSKALLQTRLTATPKAVAIERQPASFITKESMALLNSAKRKAIRTQQHDAANGLLDLWRTNQEHISRTGSYSSLSSNDSNPPLAPPPARKLTAPRNLTSELSREATNLVASSSPAPAAAMNASAMLSAAIARAQEITGTSPVGGTTGNHPNAKKKVLKIEEAKEMTTEQRKGIKMMPGDSPSKAEISKKGDIPTRASPVGVSAGVPTPERLGNTPSATTPSPKEARRVKLFESPEQLRTPGASPVFAQPHPPLHRTPSPSPSSAQPSVARSSSHSPLTARASVPEQPVAQPSASLKQLLTSTLHESPASSARASEASPGSKTVLNGGAEKEERKSVKLLCGDSPSKSAVEAAGLSPPKVIPTITDVTPSPHAAQT